jgi:hypothetical protein
MHNGVENPIADEPAIKFHLLGTIGGGTFTDERMGETGYGHGGALAFPVS